MSSEVYSVRLRLSTGEQSVTTTDEHFGAVVCVRANNDTNSTENIASITDTTTGLDVMGNATTADITAGSSAQYEQTEMGGTAIAGKLKLSLASVAGTGTFDAYVYIAP